MNRQNQDFLHDCQLNLDLARPFLPLYQQSLSFPFSYYTTNLTNSISIYRFHYCQAVRRKCLKSTNFFFRKLNEYGGDSIYKMFHAIPLLPQDKIDEGFAYIKSKVKCPLLRKLLYPIFKYFDSWWMRSVNHQRFNI